jgi:hypothetical protein
MKALVYFFSTIFLSSAIWAQSQPEMRYGQGDFVPLENATVLTTPAGSGEFWDDICYEVDLTAPVFFNAYSLVLSKMKICSDGQITLSNAAKTQNYILMPFRAEFIDKRVDESLLETSDILYETRNGFTTIEFRNVASRVEFGWYGSVNSTFTFQARIEHATGNVRYWYGESDYQSALWDIVINTNEISEAGLRIKPIVVAETAWFFTGTPGNVGVSQVLNFNGSNYPANRLREIPVNGSIIEFVWEPSTSIFNENNKMEAMLFPNPSSSGFSLLFEGEQANVFITNAQGQMIWEKHNVASGEYCSPALLQPGVYFVRILSDNRATTLTWIKR